MTSSASILSWRGDWIISRNQDMMWLQGSVVTGLALVACFLAVPELNRTNYSLTHPAVIILLLWGVFMDGTHVWATYARTYFAPDESSKAGLPKPIAWWVLAVGPLVALVDYLLFVPGPSIVGKAGALFRSFLAASYLWAYYHLIRQHYGFMVLYNRKAGGTPHGDLDRILLWVGTAYPFARFSLTDWYLASGLPQPLPARWFDGARLLLDIGFGASLAVLAVVWIFRQRAAPTPFGPKHLFLPIIIGFHMVVFALLHNLLAITASLTIFHNLQYHRIVWQYEQGKGRKPMSSMTYYVGLGLVFGLLWYGPRIMGVAAAETDLMRNVLLGFGWCVAFHHYLVDARIWRVRRSPELAHTLDRGA